MKRLSGLSLVLAALAVSSAAGVASAATTGALASGQAASLTPNQASSQFGEPVIVHGRRISDDEIKRFLCHSVGWQETSKFKFQVMIDLELERRRQQGATAEELARFQVGDAELDRKLQLKKEDFLLRYPTLDFRTEVARANLSVELYREQLRQEMTFDKVFRPENPAEWPEITKAVVVEGLGEQWIEDEKISYCTRLKRLLEQNKEWLRENGFAELAAQVEVLNDRDSPLVIEAVSQPAAAAALAKLREIGRGDIPEDDPIAVEATRSTILQALNTWAIAHHDEDAIYAVLPEAGPDSPSDAAAREQMRRERASKTLMVVDNVPVLTDAVYSRIAPYVTPDQIEDAKRFLANIALLDHDLAQRERAEAEAAAKEGRAPRKFTMTPAEFREWWPTTARNNMVMSYMEYLTQHEMLSSQVLGFPSLWSFGHYMRVMECYKRALADELKQNEVISSVLPTANQVRGAAKLNLHVLFVSAFDFDKFQWKPDGWKTARARAFELKKALDDGADWKATLELHSEWWDPPMPETGNKPVQNFYFDGTFGDQALTRNQICSYLGESEYRTFLYGPSASDEIFFNQKLGTIAGPFRGPKGYYISRVTAKSPPNRPLDLNEPIHRQIVEQDYLTRAIDQRVQTLLADGVTAQAVRGVKPGGSFSDV